MFESELFDAIREGHEKFISRHRILCIVVASVQDAIMQPDDTDSINKRLTEKQNEVVSVINSHQNCCMYGYVNPF